MPLLLSRLLTRAGDPKSAVGVLRQSVVRYPGDLWTNLDLANQSDDAADALRYFTAARAIEPQMGFCMSDMFECGMIKSEGSIAVRKELARIEPGNLNNLFRLDFSLGQTGREAESQSVLNHSREFLRAAVVRDPDDVALQGQLAVFAVLTRDYDQALTSFREVARLQPDDAECRYWLGLLLRRREHYSDSVHELREAVRILPSKVDYHDALAVALKDSNHRSSEIGELREAIRLHESEIKDRDRVPKRADVALNSSTILKILNEFDMTTSAYITGTIWGLEGSFGDGTQARSAALADALVATGNTAGAIMTYRDAVKVNPDDVELRLDFARLLKTQGATDEADAEFDKVIDIVAGQLQSKPGDNQLSQQLSTLLEQQGNVDESVAVYREAIKAQPKNTELHNGLAELLERQRKIPEAEVELDQVILLLREQLRAKEEAGSLQQLAMTILRRGHRQDAIVQLRRVIELDPKSSSACNNIAWSLATNPNAKLRDGKIAVEFATKGCELTEWKDLMILDTLAAACAESGDFEAAMKWQTKAIELSSNEKEKKDLGTRLKLYQENEPFRSARTTD